MDEYIRVTDLNEVAELKMKNECYCNYMQRGYQLCGGKMNIALGAEYYKKNPDYCDFKPGQAVKVRDNLKRKWENDVFECILETPEYVYSCERGGWIHCRHLTDDEWKELKEGKSE
jgi:hypothetical protein